jgi:hypothetical protein
MLVHLPGMSAPHSGGAALRIGGRRPVIRYRPAYKANPPEQADTAGTRAETTVGARTETGALARTAPARGTPDRARAGRPDHGRTPDPGASAGPRMPTAGYVGSAMSGNDLPEWRDTCHRYWPLDSTARANWLKLACLTASGWPNWLKLLRQPGPDLGPPASS